MGWSKIRTTGKTITEKIAELVKQKGSAKLLGSNEKVVDNWKDYKITKTTKYILYETMAN